MQILKVTGKDPEGNLLTFHVLNPTNVVVNSVQVARPGTLKDAGGNPIPIKEIKTFLHIAGQPIVCEETVDEVLEQIETL